MLTFIYASTKGGIILLFLLVELWGSIQTYKKEMNRGIEI